MFAFGSDTSGIPASWAAGAERAGVNLLPSLTPAAADAVAALIAAWRQRGDIVLVSIHWGSNWGYEIPPAQTQFAHRLIDSGCVDLIHGHSSHHRAASRSTASG
nr:CapA family protein [Alkalilimnicola ehrlichii]